MKRCEHCRYWHDSVFKGESASGWGVWFGDCGNQKSQRYAKRNLHSLLPRCEQFQEKAEGKNQKSSCEKVKE